MQNILLNLENYEKEIQKTENSFINTKIIKAFQKNIQKQSHFHLKESNKIDNIFGKMVEDYESKGLIKPNCAGTIVYDEWSIECIEDYIEHKIYRSHYENMIEYCNQSEKQH